MNEKATNKTTTPNALVGQIIMVDFFPTHRRTLRFAPQATVIPFHSTLTMTSGKRELWYSEKDVENMKLERDSDAVTLARTLLTPSAEDLNEGGIHVSQVIGLEKAVNPTQARGKSKAAWLTRCSYFFLPLAILCSFLKPRISHRRQKDRGASQDGYCQATG